MCRVVSSTSSSSVSPRAMYPQSQLSTYVIRSPPREPLALARLLLVRFGASLARVPDEFQRGEGTRIQLCGRLVARVSGRRIDRELPGRQGRLLFAYLVVNRDRLASRDELSEALWPQELPTAPGLALSALLSKLRRLLPDEALEGRSVIRLELGPEARVDLEAARDGIHRAEALVGAGNWRAATG